MVRTTLSLTIVSLCLALLSTGCGSVSSAPTPQRSIGTAPRLDEKDAAPPPVVPIGKAVRDGTFTFKVTRVRKGVTRVGGKGFHSKAAGQYVLVSVVVANRSRKSRSFFGDNAQLIGDENKGERFPADTRAATFLKGSKELYEEIAPGRSVRGVIVFDVPKKATLTAVELHDSAYSRGVRVSL